jgi:enoyl-CoA hydratase/carnithine racemase
MTQPLELRDMGGVAVLRLSRPPVNALDHATLEALHAAFRRLAASPPKNGMVFASSGGHFSAGLDLKAFRGGTDATRKAMALSINPMIVALYSLPFPTVAAIEGACLAGGLVLALGCDARIAADKGVKLGLAEVTAGVPFPLGALEVCRAELGAEARRQFFLHDRRVDGPEALQMGVVDAVASAGEIEAAACERARTLSQAAAYVPVKRQLRAPVLALIEAGLKNGDPAWGG